MQDMQAQHDELSSRQAKEQQDSAATTQGRLQSAEAQLLVRLLSSSAAIITPTLYKQQR